MPLVNIMNGQAYTIACDEGEEDHLRELAATVDAKAREVLGSVGQVGDTRLILMAALLIADEHHAMTTAKLEAAEAQAPSTRAGRRSNLHRLARPRILCRRGAGSRRRPDRSA